MKKLITLLLLSFLIIEGKSQETETLDLKLTESIKAGDSLKYGSVLHLRNTFLGEDRESQGYDTISVMLVISDTGTVRIPYQTFKRIPVPDSPNIVRIDADSVQYDTLDYKPENIDMEVVLGFQVREKFCCINGNNSQLAYYQPVPYYTHHQYLDAEKKPLSPSIIVWMAK